MDITQLKTFVQLARYRNFTKTGEALGYSQSNISAQIKNLEKDLNVILFNRIGKNISLTQAGQELLPLASEIISTAIKMENMTKDKSQLGGRVAIAFVESLIGTFDYKILLDYYKAYPNVNTEIIIDSAANLKLMLKNGEVDFACLIGNKEIQNDITNIYSKDCDIVLLGSRDNEIFDKENISIRDLENLDFILMEDTANYTGFFKYIMEKNSINYRVPIITQSPNMAIKLIENTRLISYLPKYSIEKYLKEDKVKILEIEDFNYQQWVQIFAAKNKIITPQIEGLLYPLISYFDSIIN